MDMRQGPHKNRSRSRGRRPTSNQSGRVYESNGPDVKVRGTAQTVAEKYLQLARDAHSAGDPVMAEGYFQHAEHYLRILAASQPYAQQGLPQRRPNDDYDDDSEDGDDDQPAPVASGNGDTQRQPQYQPQQPQYQQPPQPQNQQHQQQHQQQHSQQPHAHQPAAAPAASEGADEQLVEQPWGGPQPDFLRRAANNGAARPRRQRQPRGGNGRNEPAIGQDSRAEGAAGSENVASRDNPEQDTTEQA